MKNKLGVVCIFIAAVCTVAVVFVMNRMLAYESVEKTDVQPLTVLSPWNENQPEGKALADMVQRFNMLEPKQNKVKILHHPQKEFYSNLNADFESGCFPDIIFMSPYYNVDKYINRGFLIPVQEAYDNHSRIMTRLDKSFFSQITYDGMLYAMPYELNMNVMYVNKDLFRQFDVKYPENYAELKEAIEIFKRNDITPIAANIGDCGSKIFEYIIMDSMKEFELNDENFSKFDSSVQVMRELYQLGAFPDNMFTANDFEIKELFTSKRAAMMVGDLRFSASLNDLILRQSENSNRDKPYDINVDMIFFPKIRDDGWMNNILIYEMKNGAVFFTRNICDREEKKAAAERFLDFIYDEKNLEGFFNYTFTVSAVKNIWPSSYTTSFMMQAFEMQKDTFRYCNSPIMYIKDDNWDVIVMQNMPKMLVGSENTKDIWRKLIDENK